MNCGIEVKRPHPFLVAPALQPAMTMAKVLDSDGCEPGLPLPACGVAIGDKLQTAGTMYSACAPVLDARFCQRMRVNQPRPKGRSFWRQLYLLGLTRPHGEIRGNDVREDIGTGGCRLSPPHCGLSLTALRERCGVAGKEPRNLRSRGSRTVILVTGMVARTTPQGGRFCLSLQREKLWCM